MDAKGLTFGFIDEVKHACLIYCLEGANIIVFGTLQTVESAAELTWVGRSCSA